MSWFEQNKLLPSFILYDTYFVFVIFCA